jgi:ribosome-binding factor A
MIPVDRRLERLQREILRELSRILQAELNDPRMGLISLTRVKLSADLRVATVFASALGGEPEWRRSYGAIRHALGFIQKTLGGRLSIRHTPELIFRYDKTVEGAVRVHKIIDDLAEERRRRERAAPGEPPPADAEPQAPRPGTTPEPAAGGADGEKQDVNEGRDEETA